jgi:hypothetical protein
MRAAVCAAGRKGARATSPFQAKIHPPFRARGYALDRCRSHNGVLLIFMNRRTGGARMIEDRGARRNRNEHGVWLINALVSAVIALLSVYVFRGP